MLAVFERVPSRTASWLHYLLWSAPLLLAGVIAKTPQAVTTSQYGPERAGANRGEFILTPRNVDASHFGKVAVFPVDGAVYAQPLYLPAVTVPGKGLHDLVLVATEHNSVYAFDAQAAGAAEPLWHVSFTAANVTPVPAHDVECPLIAPEVGITSTPVIDAGTGTLFVLARTKERSALGQVYMQKLHALAITTGAEKFGGPQLIRAVVRGRGAANAHGAIVFDARRENPRAALLLSQGRVYLSWASSCDTGPYHGWVMAYDARTLKQVAVFNTSPDANDAGVWMSDTGPAADGAGNIYVVTGNGRFDASGGGRDYGNSILKLHWEARALTVADWFTPFNEKELDANDEDLGSGGPLLLPDHLLLAGGKGAMLYLVDRNHMGGFHEGSNAHAIATVGFGKHALFGTPAYWNGRVYVIAGGDVLREFALQNRRLVLAHRARGPLYPDAGATPAISANGSQDGIVWAISSYNWQRSGPPAVLHAYDAADVRTELYSSEQNSARDRAGEALRFTTPLVANGRVYLGAHGELDVYGVLR